MEGGKLPRSPEGTMERGLPREVQQGGDTVTQAGCVSSQGHSATGSINRVLSDKKCAHKSHILICRKYTDLYYISNQKSVL